jgi:tetratricopeptide (TPR) repeat protein
MLRFAILFVTLVVSSDAQEARNMLVLRAPQRRALVIGNQSYRVRPLAKTLNDANDMAAALRQVGFTVDLAVEASRSDIQNRTETFVASLGPGDIAWFYYSGHGFQLDGENYLVPIDLNASTLDDARKQAVAFSRIKAEIEGSPAAMSIMVLDSCRTSPVPQASASGLALLEAGLGTYIAFAASPGQAALENQKDRNGMFTGRLLAALKEPLNISELFRRVRKEVYEVSSGKQLPYIHDQIITDFYLRPPAQSNPQQPVDPTVDSAFEEGKRLFHSGRCKEALEKLDAVVRREPGNAYAQNAVGLTYACLGLLKPAVDHFSRAIDAKPAYAAAYENRGQAYIQLGEFEFAREDFDWALEQDPQSAMIHSRRGMAQLGLHQYEDADKDFTAAIALDPSNPNGFHGHGRVLYERGKYREALAAFNEALARKHDLAEALDYRTRTLDRLKQSR